MHVWNQWFSKWKGRQWRREIRRKKGSRERSRKEKVPVLVWEAAFQAPAPCFKDRIPSLFQVSSQEAIILFLPRMEPNWTETFGNVPLGKCYLYTFLKANQSCHGLILSPQKLSNYFLQWSVTQALRSRNRQPLLIMLRHRLLHHQAWVFPEVVDISKCGSNSYLKGKMWKQTGPGVEKNISDSKLHVYGVWVYELTVGSECGGAKNLKIKKSLSLHISFSC